jgi:hypothetical protein
MTGIEYQKQRTDITSIVTFKSAVLGTILQTIVIAIPALLWAIVMAVTA